MKYKKPLRILRLIGILLAGIPGISFAQMWNPSHSIGTVSGVYNFSYNQVPAQFVEIYPAAFPNTGLNYQWESSFSPTTGFAAIATGANATLTSYQAPLALTQTTYFRRKTIYPSNGAFTYSNTIKISVVSVNWEDINYVREHDVDTIGITDWKTTDQLPIGEKLQTTTYIDGLGRTVEKISRGAATPATAGGVWGDLVQFSQYDVMGREPVKYLPYSTTTQPGKFKTGQLTEQPQYYTNTYSETSAFSSIQFDNSPLNRVVNEKEPGAAWAAGAGTSATYDMNGVADTVQIWGVDYVQGDAPVNKGVYPANTLYKYTYTDLNGRQVVEYWNKTSKLILKKIQVDNAPTAAYTGWICTYSIYDDFGLLRYQLQPEAVKYLASNGWSFAGANGTQVLNELCFQYNYDDKGRTIWKKAPGAAPLYLLYDARDQVVFTQDGNQRAKSPGEWMVSFYDGLDRLSLTALYETTQTSASLQTAISNAVSTTTVTTTSTVLSSPVADLSLNARDAGIAVYSASNSIVFNTGFQSGTNDAFSTQISPNTTTTSTDVVMAYANPIPAADMADPTKFIALRYNYYDNYSYSGVKAFDNGYNNGLAYATTNPDVLPIVRSARTTNMLTGTKVRVLGTTNFLQSSLYYDEEGREVQKSEDNIIAGLDITTRQYHFDGRLLSSDSRHTTSNTAYTNYDVLTKYLFDLVGRVTSIQKKYGANAFKTIAAYDLDDMGRLKAKHLDPGYTGTGKTELESLAYSYNIHDQITGINKDYALKTAGKYSKWGNFFGLYLGYDNKDGTFAGAQLDGHVTGTLWSTQGDDVQRKYDFSYDNAGRLIKALYGEKQNTGDAWSNSKMDFSVTGTSGQITYDLNGNLLTMLQKGVAPGQSAPITVDDLRYSYAAYSNKLQSVTDQMTATTFNGRMGDFKDGSNAAGTPDYVYDNNGNVVVDLNKNAQSLNNGAAGTNGISYNFLDKPDQVRLVGKGLIHIVYDADGNKLKKIFTPEGSSIATTTTYIDEFVYQSIGGGTDSLQYINFEEGRIRVVSAVTQNNGYDLLTIDGNMDLPGSQRGAYDFFIRDYQSNVRMILTEESDKGSNSCTMETARAANEEPLFGQVDASGVPTAANEVKARFAVSGIPGQSSGGGWQNSTIGSYVSRVGNLAGNKIGPNTLLKVMAGDSITATTIYYYQDPVVNTTGTSMITNLLTSLAAAITGGGATSGLLTHGAGPAAGITSPLGNSVPFTSVADPDQNNTAGTTPKAYLTILFFDERFNFVQQGSVAARVIQAGTGAPALVLPIIQAPKNGYAYVYVSNESDQMVYFDNLQVANHHSAIIEEDHYYAYGLKIAGISSRKLPDPNERHLDNKNLYNDKELIDEADLNWYDYGFRSYDAQIGRFVQLDPLTDDYPFLTPYQFASCEPIANVDADGLEAEIAVSGLEEAVNTTRSVEQVAYTVLPTAAQMAAKAARTVAPTALSVAGSFIKGIGQSLLGTVVGVGNAIVHPIATVTGIAHAVVHPIETAKAVGKAVSATYHEFKNGNANTRANILGKLTGEVGQLLIGVGEAKAATEAVETAEVVRKAEEVEKLVEVEKVEKGLAKEGKLPCGCFLAGTLVLTDSGYKRIEDIRPGMLVWAYNDTTHAYDTKKVLRIFEHVRDTVYQVHIGDEIVSTTSDHPFFVGGRWLRVKDLHPGDSVLTYSGNKLVVSSINLVVKRTTVHNFEVSGFHTYYVSAQKILVHNNGPCDIEVKDFNQARNKAVEWLEERGFKSEKPTAGKFGNKGKNIGRQSADGKTGFRVEFDERNGAHINVWHGKVKGPHIKFKASEQTVNKLHTRY